MISSDYLKHLSFTFIGLWLGFARHNASVCKNMMHTRIGVDRQVPAERGMELCGDGDDIRRSFLECDLSDDSNKNRNYK